MLRYLKCFKFTTFLDKKLKRWPWLSSMSGLLKFTTRKHLKLEIIVSTDDPKVDCLLLGKRMVRNFFASIKGLGSSPYELESNDTCRTLSGFTLLFVLFTVKHSLPATYSARS
ncbi:hypothetical protein CsSME_00045842 [Camellia sinensis var. sinensis]